MSSVFTKTINLKNVSQFRFLFNFMKKGRNITCIKSPLLATSSQSFSSFRNDVQVSFTVSKDASKVSLPSILVEFLQFVKNEDTDKMLAELQNMKKGFVRKIPLHEMTVVMDLLIKKGRLFDLSCCVQAMSYILDNENEILKPLMENYSISGDINSLHEIAKLIPDFALMKCSYNHYLTKAYIKNERYEDVLLELENNWNAKNTFFSIIGFEELLKKTEYEERVVNLAKKYFECKDDFPLAVVWAHYLVNNKFAKANELLEAYSISVDKVDVIVLRALSQQENIRMGLIYISALNHLNAKSRCKERAYGTLLNILVSKKMYKDATELINNAKENKVYLDEHYKSTMIKLQNALEIEKKDAPSAAP